MTAPVLRTLRMSSAAASVVFFSNAAHCSGVPQTRFAMWLPSGLKFLQIFSGSTIAAGAAVVVAVDSAAAARSGRAARRRSRRDPAAGSAGAALGAAAGGAAPSCANAPIDGATKHASVAASSA